MNQQQLEEFTSRIVKATLEGMQKHQAEESKPKSNVKVENLLRPFTGKTNFCEWIKKFELVSENVGWEKNHVTLPLFLFLEREAFEVYQNFPSNTKAEYKLVKQSLLKAFCKGDTDAYDDFISRKLRLGENVDYYAADLQNLARIIGEPDVQSSIFVKMQFLKGLPSETSALIRSLCSENFVSMAYQELVQMSKQFLKQSESFEYVGAIQRKKNVVCFKCREQGHYANECTADQRVRKCFICQSESHLSNTCPNNVYKRQGNGRGGGIASRFAPPNTQ